ncbi:hypothetical protein HETIRDRAFT_123080 [Heterobasidion irregulare TC 32-1]|uniref:RING-type domain-containing protein n=1 Tax=Heterobasidion irregulare (strain TC 32-1) TaxID=747525 RepID=W4K3Z6_HETIT|nr:uncharacterized protein HETIRDRAFT_123080 [Heterobasidion irregulare TC 32-1]ETW80558.1 hypothetical protein HETIRDRAFT_123080 [Heterobasidion irregulare TC 32-1]
MEQNNWSSSSESYTYVDPPNSNLVCCICRMPFVEPTTTRTCSHTFCRGCINQALKTSPQCPIDRSPLQDDDLLAASPIVRHLVEELVVECPHRPDGCAFTCQRQLLASHLQGSCPYVHVPCPHGDCEEPVLRKDAKKYASAYHDASCMDRVIACTHEDNGCPWTGPRRSLLDKHIPACPYEAIKGFFGRNNDRISALSQENILLRQKLEASDGMMQILRRELRAVKTALGPWYRPDGSYTFWSQDLLTDGLSDSHLTDGSADTPAFPYYPAGQPSSPGFNPAHSQSPTSPFANLALYFPPAFPSSNPSDSNSGANPYHPHPTSVSDARAGPSTAMPIAPLNLSTSLTGTLAGLHSTLSTLAASHDALARLTELALATETARTAEELGALRAVVNGLRMHVHAIMMDRNALFAGTDAGSATSGTGTGAGAGMGAAGWPPQRFYPHPSSAPGLPLSALSSSPASITKL